MALMLTRFNVCMNEECVKRESIGIGPSSFSSCQGCGLVKYCSEKCAQGDEWHIVYCKKIQKEHGLRLLQTPIIGDPKKTYELVKRKRRKRDVYLTFGLFGYVEAKRKMNYFSMYQTRGLIEKAMRESSTVRRGHQNLQKNCERLKDASKAIFCAYVYLGDYRGAASVADTQCHGKLVVLLMKWKLIVKKQYQDYEYFPEYQHFLDMLMERPENTPERRLRGVIPALEHIKRCLLIVKTKDSILQEVKSLQDEKVQKKMVSMIMRDEIPPAEMFYTF